MKKTKLFSLLALSALALSGCSLFSSTSDSTTSTTSSGTTESYGSAYDYTTEVTLEEPEEITVEETTSEFSLVTEDGAFTQSGNIYTITSAGVYTATGKLDGQILVEAGEDDVVELELNGVTISYDQDSPIKAVSGDKLEVSAKKETGNVVIDNRSAKTVDSETQGEGAISADIDLKLKGAGTLVVTGNYNNAVHTTKDLTIQKLTLKATGYNNAVKGKDSVTIVSGEVQAYAKTGNGIKTDNSDVSSKGNQRGTISIEGGTVYVDSLHDAIDATYNVVVDELDSEVPTSVSIKTGKKSSFYSSSFKADSEKGLKAAKEIISLHKGKTKIDKNNSTITFLITFD